MTPVEELQAAAERIRQVTTAASIDMGRRLDARWPEELNEWLGGPIGEHAALWSPLVALAVADWLDVIAKTAHEYFADGGQFPVVAIDGYAQAEDVARAINGSPT